MLPGLYITYMHTNMHTYRLRTNEYKGEGLIAATLHNHTTHACIQHMHACMFHTFTYIHTCRFRVSQYQGGGLSAAIQAYNTYIHTCRFRVNQYQGGGLSAAILASKASVSLYTEDFTKDFEIAKDGFVDVSICWFLPAGVCRACICVSMC